MKTGPDGVTVETTTTYTILQGSSGIGGCTSAPTQPTTEAFSNSGIPSRS